MRSFLAVLSALGLACAGAQAPAAPGAPGPEELLLRGPELARVRCLLIAPFENASDAPLASEIATSAAVTGVDPNRTKVFPVPELRNVFRDTPLELPEGVAPSLALELADLVGADAALYGAVEGRGRGPGAELRVTVRLLLTTPRDLLFAASAPVRPATGERLEDAVRRTLLETARPVLARLGGEGRHRCFDPDRTKKLRQYALAEARAALPPPPLPPAPAKAVPVPAATPVAPAARGQPRTPRQVEWAMQVSARKQFVLEDVLFGARTADLARDGGLADLAVVLSANPETRVRIEAFVDATSDPEGDARLSAAMAQATVRRLGDLGVAPDRLTWAGRGGESPILPNFTVRGRAANRRIEIVGLP
jgi:outer membrane protein OmpA-like peptidoglycan-associated protein